MKNEFPKCYIFKKSSAGPKTTIKSKAAFLPWSLSTKTTPHHQAVSETSHSKVRARLIRRVTMLMGDQRELIWRQLSSSEPALAPTLNRLPYLYSLGGSRGCSWKQFPHEISQNEGASVAASPWCARTGGQGQWCCLREPEKPSVYQAPRQNMCHEQKGTGRGINDTCN